MTRSRLIILIRLVVLLGLSLWYAADYLLAAMLMPLALFMPAFSSVTCLIFTDDFSTDRTGTDYTIVSGTPTVSGGVLTTTSAGFLIVEDAAGSTGHGRAEVYGKVDTYGGSFEVLGSYVDSSNFLFVRVTINSGANASVLQLFKKVAGVDTQLGIDDNFSAFTNTDYLTVICWDGSYAHCQAIPGAALGPFASGVFTGSGNQAGLGANPNGGTVTFEDFTFTHHQDDNPACSQCLVGCGCVILFFGDMDVEISGNSTGLDGVYSCAWNSLLSGPTCRWEYTSGGTPDRIRVNIFELSNDYILQVTIRPSGDSDSTFEKVMGQAPFDCAALVDEVVSLVSGSIDGTVTVSSS